MKNYAKFIGLLGLLAPIALYFLFKPLAKIPRPRSPHKLYPVGMAEVKDPSGKVVNDTVYHIIPNQKFETQFGTPFELDSLRGKIYIADFFFATCPGICPAMNKQMKRIQDAFIRDGLVKIVSITVDPDRDSLPVLKDYANRYGAIADKWIFLRAPKPEVYKLARDGFFVTAKEEEGGGEDGFIHSEKLVLVDPQGNIRGYYSGIDSNRVSQLMGDLVLLLREYEKTKPQGFSRGMKLKELFK